MDLRQIENLLPKKLTDRVALKTLYFEHQLSRFRGLRKQINIKKRLIIRPIRVIALLSFGLYFAGYQPVLAFPPLKQAIVSAQYSQEQVISAASFSEAFILPHPGYITTRFSSWHPGLDIATGYNMPIHPIAKGVVIDTIRGWWGLGHYVVIEHEQGLRSTYGHMGKIYVKVADPVTTESIIGTVGMTGRTTGPHTHLEITKDGQYINPETLLPAIPDWPKWQQPAPVGQGETKKESPKKETPKEVKPQEDLKVKLMPINLQNIERPQTESKLKLSLPQWSPLAQP